MQWALHRDSLRCLPNLKVWWVLWVREHLHEYEEPQFSTTTLYCGRDQYCSLQLSAVLMLGQTGINVTRQSQLLTLSAKDNKGWRGSRFYLIWNHISHNVEPFLFFCCFGGFFFGLSKGKDPAYKKCYRLTVVCTGGKIRLMFHPRWLRIWTIVLHFYYQPPPPCLTKQHFSTQWNCRQWWNHYSSTGRVEQAEILLNIT